MPVVHARIRVDADGTISGEAPQDVPPGEYDIRIDVAAPKRPERKPLDLPLHDCGPWPEGFTVRREEIYRRVRRPL
jgi:hypothetical protein